MDSSWTVRNPYRIWSPETDRNINKSRYHDCLCEYGLVCQYALFEMELERLTTEFNGVGYYVQDDEIRIPVQIFLTVG